jgi:hypothetical protein
VLLTNLNSEHASVVCSLDNFHTAHHCLQLKYESLVEKYSECQSLVGHFEKLSHTNESYFEQASMRCSKYQSDLQTLMLKENQAIKKKHHYQQLCLMLRFKNLVKQFRQRKILRDVIKRIREIITIKIHEQQNGNNITTNNIDI